MLTPFNIGKAVAKMDYGIKKFLQTIKLFHYPVVIIKLYTKNLLLSSKTYPRTSGNTSRIWPALSALLPAHAWEEERTL